MKLVLSFLLLFGGFVSNITAQTDSLSWTTYSNEKYQINYPNTWTIDDSGKLGAVFFLFGPQDSETDNFAENINLMVQDLSVFEMSFEEFVELSTVQIKTMTTGGAPLVNETLNADDQQYQRLVFTNKQGDFDLKFVQYFLVIDKTAYILTLTCEESQFDQYQSLGEQIMKSFEVLQ